MGQLPKLDGLFRRVLDGRGRVVFPAAWRQGLLECGDGVLRLTCSPSLEGHWLEFRTEEGYERWVSLLARRQPSGRLSGTQLSLLSKTLPVEVDSRGSITLPGVLVKLVGLKRDAVWESQGDCLVLRNT